VHKARPRRDADHSFPCSAEVKNACSGTALLLTVFYEREAKPSVPCRKIHGMLQNSMSVKEKIRRQNSRQVSPPLQ
jgi:hypothetical protein